MNLDGGRLPVAGTIPDLSKLIDAATNTGEGDLGAGDWRPGPSCRSRSSTLGLPYGGGQLRKLYQGIDGGRAGRQLHAWTSRREPGAAVSRYTTDTVAGKAAGSTVTGVRSSGKSAHAGRGRTGWTADSRGFNAKADIAAYQGHDGRPASGRRQAYKLLEGMSKIKKTDTMTADEAKRDYLLNADIPDEGKIVCYYALMASDKEKANIQEAIKAGVGINDYLKTKNAAAETEAEKDADGKAVPGSKKMQMYEAIDDLKLTADQKDVLAQKQGYTDTSDAPWHGMNYDKLENVVRTGKGLQSLLASMQKAGVQNADISGAITTLFKAEYQKANKSEQAELKARILTACELLGISRKTKAKQIDGWVK
jgi:hypothetical protein